MTKDSLNKCASLYLIIALDTTKLAALDLLEGRLSDLGSPSDWHLSGRTYRGADE